jgi:hypothetical protein
MRVYWEGDGLQLEGEDEAERKALKILFHAARKTDLRTATLERFKPIEKASNADQRVRLGDIVTGFEPDHKPTTPASD